MFAGARQLTGSMEPTITHKNRTVSVRETSMG
jgi:hypothetical protein